MAKHSLYPGFVKLTYTSNGHVHHQVLPIHATPTASGDSYTLETKGSGAVEWVAAATAWATLLAVFLDPTANFSQAELFTLEATTAPADFLQGASIDVDGTNESPIVPFSQMVFPFKGVAGVSMRPYLMEGIESVDQHVSYAAAGVADKAIMDFVLSDDAWMCTRGGAFPTVALGWVTKTNDELRKRFFVP